MPVVAAIALAGCGDTEDFANEPRPPAPINIDAAITPGAITVDPPSFGGGPVILRVANLTERTHKVTLESAGGGVRQTTSAINPGGVGQLKVDLEQGRYTVSAGGDLGTARIRVGDQRPSAQDELLQP